MNKRTFDLDAPDASQHPGRGSMKKALVSMLLLSLAGIASAPAAHADQEAPEAILERKGLVRDGVSLVLKDAAARDERFRQLEGESQRLMARIEPLLFQRRALEQAVSDARARESNAKDYEDVEYTVYDPSSKKYEVKKE